MENIRKLSKANVSNLRVVDDAVEKALGLAAESNSKNAAENENKLQDLYKGIREAREKLRAKATSDEAVTKKITSCCKL